MQNNHSVVWFEVVGRDGDKLRRFYGELFGWKLEPEGPMKYATLSPNGGGKGIPGGIGELAPLAGTGFPSRPWVTVYVHTDDVAASLARAEKLGGRVVLPARKLPDGPEIALFEDPEGQIIGLVRSM